MWAVTVLTVWHAVTHLLCCCPLSKPSPAHFHLQRSDNAQANSATPRDMAKPTSYPHVDAVNVSPEIAERRADLGKDASLGQIQAFDGPAPETINGEPRHVHSSQAGCSQSCTLVHERDSLGSIHAKNLGHILCIVQPDCPARSGHAREWCTRTHSTISRLPFIPWLQQPCFTDAQPSRFFHVVSRQPAAVP
jgi:hypothetical protein